MAEDFKKELKDIDESLKDYEWDPFNEDLNNDPVINEVDIPKDKVLRNEAETRII